MIIAVLGGGNGSHAAAVDLSLRGHEVRCDQLPLDRFSQATEEALPVIDNPEARRVIGYLSEAYALRRYAHELERRRGSRPDDAGIFSPIPETPVGPTPRQK